MPSRMSELNRSLTLASANNARRRLTFDGFMVNSSMSRSHSVGYASGDGGSSRSSAQELLRALASDIDRQQRNRWNFDFGSCTPLDGRYQWWPQEGASTDSDDRVRPRPAVVRLSTPTTEASSPTVDSGFIPIEPQRCRADEEDGDHVTAPWRQVVATTANAQTQTLRPVMELLPVVAGDHCDGEDTLPSSMVVDQSGDDHITGGLHVLPAEERRRRAAETAMVDDEFVERRRLFASEARECRSGRQAPHLLLQQDTSSTRRTVACGRVTRRWQTTTSSSIRHHPTSIKRMFSDLS